METKELPGPSCKHQLSGQSKPLRHYPSTPGYHLSQHQLPTPDYYQPSTQRSSHHQLPTPDYYQPSIPKSSHRPPQVFQPHATVFSPKQSVEQITARFHRVSDAGRMAVQLAVKHFFGEDVMVSNTAGSLDSSKMRNHQDHHLGEVWGKEV